MNVYDQDDELFPIPQRDYDKILNITLGVLLSFIVFAVAVLYAVTAC